MTKNTEKTEANGATPCECSKYDALVNAQLTEENLANGDYEVFTTGCNATTKREFAPGHDAKLKSFLIRYSGPEYDVRRNDGGVSVSASAQGHADRYEFGYMVAAGIAKAAEKAKAKAEREAARAAKKAAKGKPAERKLAESAGVVAPAKVADVVAAEEAAYAEAEAKKVAEREASADWDEAPSQGVDLTDEPEVIAKVGRWEYKGIVKDGVLYYLAKDGHTRKTADKFTVVREV